MGAWIMDEVYQAVIEGLSSRSVQSYFQQSDQLVVSRQSGPAWPGPGNSFWISHQQGAWYLCTWAPVCYRVPQDTDLVALCVDFVGCGEYAQSRVPADLVDCYRLVELSNQEAGQVFGKEDGLA
jgi:hypothetical protein